MSESPPADNPIDLEMEKLKIHSESKPKEFSNLPTDALNLIIDKLELKERLILRKVSSGLRAFVDQQKSILTEIRFVFCEDHILTHFNSNIVVYAAEVECTKFKSHYRCEESKVIICKDYLETALDDLKSAVKDPKLQLNALRVEFFSSYPIFSSFSHLKKFSEELEAILKSLNHKISTKTFDIRVESADQILAALPYLKPGTLQCIEFSQNEASWRISDAEFDQIAMLEQWKQAKKLILSDAGDMWLKKHLIHFEEIYIFDECCLGPEEIREWTDLFSESKHFITGHLVTTDGFYPWGFQNHISDGVPILISGEEFENPTYLIEHPIRDDPDQYLEIEVHVMGYGITFKKLARQSS